MAERKTRKTGRTAGRRKKMGTAKQGASLLKFEIIGLVCIFLGIFATIGIIGVDTGSIGYSLDGLLAYGFGFGRIVASLSLIVLGLKYIMVRKACPVTKQWLVGFWIYSLFFDLDSRRLHSRRDRIHAGEPARRRRRHRGGAVFGPAGASGTVRRRTGAYHRLRRDGDYMEKNGLFPSP